MKVIHRFKTYKGDEYKVVLQKKVVCRGKDCYGTCDPPDDEDVAFIKLEEKQGDLRMIETMLHEMAHAFFPMSCETNVDRFSKAVMTLYKKTGLLVKVNAPRCRSKPSKRRTSR